MERGLFITFEGGEGSGKTTQLKLLEQRFAASGRKCLLTREPGGSEGAEAIRNLLVTGSAEKWDTVAETLLFQAARVEHVQRVIEPALSRGDIVLCDRFLDSTLVYQGLAKGLGLEYVRRLHLMTLGSFMPHLTFLLDIAPETGLARAKSRPGEETRFEHMDMAFHHSVRAGFLRLAGEQPERYAVIDAARTSGEVHEEIALAVSRHVIL